MILFYIIIAYMAGKNGKPREFWKTWLGGVGLAFFGELVGAARELGYWPEENGQSIVLMLGLLALLVLGVTMTVKAYRKSV